MNIKSISLRLIEFKVKNKIPYADLINQLIPKLTPLGMMIEKSSDKNGAPVITYQKLIYDITYDPNKEIFTIWWRKNIARAFFVIDYINMYRKIVIAMGIIGYNIQQICDFSVSSKDSMELESTPIKSPLKDNFETTYCSNCGKEIMNNAKFCNGCGVRVHD